MQLDRTYLAREAGWPGTATPPIAHRQFINLICRILQYPSREQELSLLIRTGQFPRTRCRTLFTFSHSSHRVTWPEYPPLIGSCGTCCRYWAFIGGSDHRAGLEIYVSFVQIAGMPNEYSVCIISLIYCSTIDKRVFKFLQFFGNWHQKLGNSPSGNCGDNETVIGNFTLF